MSHRTLRYALLSLCCATAGTAPAQTLFSPVTFSPTETFPSAREGHAMAVEASGDVILFGGQNGTGVLSDTWRFDGKTRTWAELTSGVTSPQARHGHVMATIPDGSGSTEILMFGGQNLDGLRDDTWRWDGSNWTRVMPAMSPSARSGAMMAADPTGAILFGGNTSVAGVNPNGETWRYAAGNWGQIFGLNPEPPARADGGMAAAEAPYLIALYGGRNSTTDLSDSWYFDPVGNAWTQESQSSEPPARHGMTMTWDDLRDRWVMHGGFTGSTVRVDTWELRPDPTALQSNLWRQANVPVGQPPSPPLASSAAEFVGDVGVLGAVVFFGGRSESGLVSTTWLYGPRHTPLIPTPAPVGNPESTDPLTDPRVLLGHILFYEEQMSATRTMACATCHMPEAGGTDPRPAVLNAKDPSTADDDVWGSAGVIQNRFSGLYEPAVSPTALFGLNPQVTGRKSPSNLNAFLFFEQFWDGRARQEFKNESGATVTEMGAGASIESQAVGPPVSSVEMAHMDDANWGEVTARLANVTPLALASNIPLRLEDYIGTKTYPQLCNEAFAGSAAAPGPGVTRERVALALAAYQRTLLPTEATVLKLNYPGKGTPAERGGFIFESANPGLPRCSQCHEDGMHRRKTDNDFHYIGAAPRSADLGRFAVQAGLPDDQRGAMKTPSLFNVALHNRFFHNGRASTLREVIDFYVAGGEFEVDHNAIRPITHVPVPRPPGASQAPPPRSITEQDKNDLVAYLESFTDPRLLEPVLQPPFDRPTLRSETMPPNPELYGFGTACGITAAPAAIAIEPPHRANNRFIMGLQNGPNNAVAVLVIGAAKPDSPGGQPAPGYTSFVESSSIITTLPVGGLSFHPVTGGYTSTTMFNLHFGAPIGTELYCQWVIYADGPCPVTATEGVKVTVIGP
ncbi:MAG: cytochrome c peroxidase [Planctomycetota bacterium]